ATSRRCERRMWTRWRRCEWNDARYILLRPAAGAAEIDLLIRRRLFGSFLRVHLGIGQRLEHLFSEERRTANLRQAKRRSVRVRFWERRIPEADIESSEWH